MMAKKFPFRLHMKIPLYCRKNNTEHHAKWSITPVKHGGGCIVLWVLPFHLAGTRKLRAGRKWREINAGQTC